MKNFDLNSFESTELLKSSKGSAKESIYKNEIFKNVENKKEMRIKLRKLMYNYCNSILSIKDINKCKSLAKDFQNFYTSAYRVNDFTLSSIASANTDGTKKEILKKGIEKFAKLLNK